MTNTFKKGDKVKFDWPDDLGWIVWIGTGKVKHNQPTDALIIEVDLPDHMVAMVPVEYLTKTEGK